ncbi:MAG: phosphoheptose isomerase [Betaproteobacteria bacterium]|nr:phosphoheptose isomerase [Betaproteobacteria bacterium]
MEQRIAEHFAASIATKQQVAGKLGPHIARASKVMVDCLKSGGKILACGNGGSAADSQHFAAELVGRFEREREELAAIALTTDSSILTAVANDYSYDEIFSKQVRALGKPGDILFGISTSGNSKNVITAIEAAKKKGLIVIGMTGRNGGKIGEMMGERDVLLNVESTVTARIQEVHLLTLHCLCDAIDNIMFGEK